MPPNTRRYEALSFMLSCYLHKEKDRDARQCVSPAQIFKAEETRGTMASGHPPNPCTADEKGEI